MDLQTVFYTLGVIFFSLVLAFMLAVVIFIFWIKGKINNIQRQIDKKIGAVTTIARAGSSIASGMGNTVAGAALEGVSKILAKTKSKRKRKS